MRWEGRRPNPGRRPSKSPNALHRPRVSFIWGLPVITAISSGSMQAPRPPRFWPVGSCSEALESGGPAAALTCNWWLGRGRLWVYCQGKDLGRIRGTTERLSARNKSFQLHQTVKKCRTLEKLFFCFYSIFSFLFLFFFLVFELGSSGLRYFLDIFNLTPRSFYFI